jgi:hypothetical protein
LVSEIEERWQGRFGAELMARLWKSLSLLVRSGDLASSPLRTGLQPYTDGWRAKTDFPLALPYFPMVLHRGGYPDGA